MRRVNPAAGLPVLQPLASTLSKDTEDEDSDDEEEVQQPKPDVKATPLNCFM